MNVTEYLSQGRRLDEMIRYHAERLESLRARADGISALRIREAAVKTSAGDAPYVRALQGIWELEETIDRELRLLIRLDGQMTRVINGLLNPDYRMLIRYRYMNRKTWEQIADLMHIDPRTARRWHAKAVSLITLPEDAICIRETDPRPAA